MNVSLERFFVVEAADEKHLLTKLGERRKDFAHFHLFSTAFGPPFFRMKTVAGEKDGEPDRSFAGGLDGGGRDIAPDIERFHPGERHADADPAQKCAPGEWMTRHSV